MTVAETARLRLRELTLDDAAFILELVNDPAWLRYIGDRNVRSLDDARGYIERAALASYAREGFGLWAVTLVTTGVAIGLCGLIRRDALAHVDLGFAFLPRHRGQGYARESAQAVVELARERFGIGRLVAITHPENVPSHKVLESVGFRFEQTVHWAATAEDLRLYARGQTP